MNSAKLSVEYLPVGDLRPYERNAKKHPRQQLDQIKRSILDMGNGDPEKGFLDPIGIWGEKNIIVEGHGRLLAAIELGMKTVPVIRLDQLTDEQRRQYTLIHNQTTMNSGFDIDIVNLELLDMPDFDATFYGFDIPENEEVVEDNYEPVVPEEPRAKIGDIYELGRHRLMCGDSTVAADVLHLVNGAAIDMLLTDPPYNVALGTGGMYKMAPEMMAGHEIKENGAFLLNDNMSDEDFVEFLTKAFSNAAHCMKTGAAFHIWHADQQRMAFEIAMKRARMRTRQHLIWVKNTATLGRQDFQHQYESVMSGELVDLDEDQDTGYAVCIYGWKEGGSHTWYKKRKERDVMFFDKPVASKDHPTMKPVLMFDYEMKCNTKPGDCVLDLFAGSGTTLIAAEQNGRRAFCMEFDPKFVDVIVDRWEKFTGRKAVLLNGERRESESSNLG